MTYMLKVGDQHIEMLCKALQAFRDIHLGRLDALAAIPSLAEDTTQQEFTSYLMGICPLITGRVPGQGLSLDGKEVALEAQLANDYYEVISASLAGKSVNGSLVTGQVTEEQFAQE